MDKNVEIISAHKTDKERRDRSGEGLLKVAAYCRVSTGNQEQLDSYNSQKKYYGNLIESNPEWISAGIYADEAITGTKIDKRLEFKRMIEDAFSGKIDLIICKSISRFARNTVDTLQYVRLLREHQVGVFFEEENIRTLSMDGELLLTILSSVAQQEVENLSEHVKTGLRHKMTSGQMVGFSGCLGYDYDPVEKKIVINEEEAEIVRYIYRRYIEGVGCKTIARECTEKGWKTKKGGTVWYETSVALILKNEKYKGDLLSGKTFTVDPIGKRRLRNKGEADQYLVRNHHQMIISEEEWLKVQEIFNKRKITYDDSGGRKCDRFSRQYAFSSKLECGFCHNFLSRRTNNNGNPKLRTVVWQCVNYVKNGKKNCPYCKSIKESLIETAFVEVVNKLLDQQVMDMDQFMKDAESVINSKKYDSDLNVLERRVNECEKKKGKLIDLYMDQLISKDDYNARYEEYEKKLKELNKVLKRTSDLKEESDKQKMQLLEFKKVIKSNSHLDKFDPVIFEKLVDRVIVGGIDESGNPDPYELTFILKISVSNIGGNGSQILKKIGLNTNKTSQHPYNINEDNSSVSVEACRNCMLSVPPKEGCQSSSAGSSFMKTGFFNI